MQVREFLLCFAGLLQLILSDRRGSTGAARGGKNEVQNWYDTQSSFSDFNLT
jgi:hypothetical protein